MYIRSPERNCFLLFYTCFKTVYWLPRFVDRGDRGGGRPVDLQSANTYRGAIHARETYFPREFRLPIIKTKVWTVSSKRYENGRVSVAKKLVGKESSLAAVNNGQRGPINAEPNA